MGKRLVTILLAGTLVVLAGFFGAANGSASSLHAQTVASSCKPNAYTTSCKACVSVPTHGKFSLSVPGVKDKLLGTGTKNTAGTKICLTKVPKPNKSLGGSGERVTATGKFKPLHLAHGKLYRFIPATNKTVRVGTVDRKGIYQIVP